ncbi:MAG: MerR family transcriptional regulator [Rhodospirillales bacterium]|nr:MerR family transcriptional regulator [Acetobacter sp.]
MPLGIGYYTVPEAARLLRIPSRNINRWLGGYRFPGADKATEMSPLWEPQLPRGERHIELGFRDLIELRFVKAFLDAGLSLLTIRRCIEYARECVQDDRPFSTRQFQTDGRTIFLQSSSKAGEEELLDLKHRQYVIKQVIERTFRDLDVEHDTVARWRPFKGKASIVVDPKRSFGQPVAANYGVPTVALADAVEAEGSEERVAALYDVPPSIVHDALGFERSLQAA